MNWITTDPHVLGYIPEFLRERDPRPAAEQFNENYHFGGWRPLKGFKHSGDYVLTYPGDPPLRPKAMTKLRDETICVYDSAWVAIFQPNGSFEVARLD